MANKCITVSARVIPNISEIRILNDSARNVEVKKIIQEKEKEKGMIAMKIQFKDEEIGKKFMGLIEKSISKEL